MKRFNRTRMELKLRQVDAKRIEVERFNRTRMELKQALRLRQHRK